MISVDYTHVEGRNEMRQINLNPIVNGTRVLVPDFIRVFGVANVLSNVNIRAGINRSRYDALTTRFQRRFPRATLQAHYTLAGAYSFGGSTGNRSGAGLAQDQFDQFADSEWGPNGPDERHRFVFTGVFDLPWGIQLSPVFQAVSARPYNLTAGTDLNADGTNNDRWIDPATGTAGLAQLGARRPYVPPRPAHDEVLRVRGGQEGWAVRRSSSTSFNTANFGGQYNGNARSVTFRATHRVHPWHRLPAPSTARRAVPVLNSSSDVGWAGCQPATWE